MNTYINKVRRIAFKAIIILPSLAGVAGGLASCSSDPLVGSGEYKTTVSIVSQNVSFDAPASQGTIEYSAPGTATVYSSSDWCQVSMKDNTVNVSATQNSTRNSRSCNVVIKCGTDSAVVNVIQKGFVFSISAGKAVTANTDAAQKIACTYSENLDFKVSSSADWFTVSMDDDSLIISMTENATGHIRKGYLYYTTGAVRDSITVMQYEYAKDIAGSAYLYFKDKNNTLYHTDIVLADSCFSLPDYAKYGEWKVPFTFNAEKMMFSFTNAQDVGMYNNTYYVSDAMFGSGYYCLYKSVSWDAYVTYNEKEGYMEADMVDNGSWSYPFEGFYLRAFSSDVYSSVYDKGAIVAFYSPVIIRYDQTSTAKALDAKYLEIK